MNEIDEILNDINDFFYTNKTKDVDFRLEALRLLKNAIVNYEPQLVQAIRDDLRKPDFEIYTTEIGVTLQEIDYAIKHLKRWAKPEKVSVPFYLTPSKGLIFKEPYGTALIIGAFNYPFQLLMSPLIGAIAAGNCVVLKTSTNTPETARIIFNMIEETFESDYIKCIYPSTLSTEELIHAKFDYIFFTGSSKTGKIIAQAAAANLVPYTLELGGKSPTIVDKTANIEDAAKKIVWGKFLNSGQSCIAPDYILAHSEIKEKLVYEIIRAVKNFFGVIPQQSKDLGRIVNEVEFFRLKDLIEEEEHNIIYGGKSEELALYIEPTLLDIKSFDSPIMREEIFGPVLPILSYKNIDDVISILRKKDKPLALYIFSKDKELSNNVIKSLSYGGGCVNDTINHIVSPTMPFGGVGNSGIGAYHGKYTFDTFTHLKSILINKSIFNTGLMFPPYSSKVTKMIRKFFK